MTLRRCWPPSFYTTSRDATAAVAEQIARLNAAASYRAREARLATGAGWQALERTARRRHSWATNPLDHHIAFACPGKISLSGATAFAWARRVRRKVGLSQVAFAWRIGVPVDKVRATGSSAARAAGLARALLRIIDRAPETALEALDRT